MSGVSDLFLIICFSINTSRRWEKLEFLHTLFLENTEEISEKKNTEQYFLTGMKFTCQITVTLSTSKIGQKPGGRSCPEPSNIYLLLQLITSDPNRAMSQSELKAINASCAEPRKICFSLVERVAHTLLANHRAKQCKTQANAITI